APPTATTAAPAEEQILYDYGIRSGDPASHDFNRDLYCGGVASIWSGLLTYSVDFEPIPDWAESWEANADASVWTFNLRPNNGGFSNGDDVTADVFIYSWKRLLNPESAGAYASILFDILNAEEVNTAGADPETLGLKAIDDWTLEVTMVGPRGIFPVIAGYAACFPTHPPSVEEFGDEYTDPNITGQDVISNGAFILKEWVHDVRCTVVKNPNYWDADNIRPETIVNPIIPAEQGLLPYEAGEIDWSVVPLAELPRVQADPVMSKELEKWVEPLIWKILPGTNVAPFDDIRVRRALSHCIDRDRINELINQGGDPAYCLMPPGLFGYMGDDEEIRAIQAFDPEAAMAALVGTPFEGGQNWPTVTMIMRNEPELASPIIAEDIVAQVKDHIGLTIELQIMDFQAFRELQFQNNYELCFIRWYYDYPDPNNGYFDMFYSNKESGKRQAWSNAEFDQLTIDGKEEADPAKRLEIYRKAEIIMQTEVAYIPVVYRNAYDVYKPWVKGVPVNKQGYVIPNGNIYVSMWNTMYIEGREA
ncbi:MAG: peptide ABC transporter substrate-binding protein, partial [Chloroflexi bacterium]